MSGKVQEAHAFSFQRGQASRSLLVLDYFPDPIAVHRFGSLLLSSIVCVCRSIWSAVEVDVCAKFPPCTCRGHSGVKMWVIQMAVGILYYFGRV